MRWPMVVYRGGGFDGQEAGTENRPDENKRKWWAAVSAGRGRHIGESLQVDAGGWEYGEFSESLKGYFPQSVKRQMANCWQDGLRLRMFLLLSRTSAMLRAEERLSFTEKFVLLKVGAGRAKFPTSLSLLCVVAGFR